MYSHPIIPRTFREQPYRTENETESIFLNTNSLSLITMKNIRNNFNSECLKVILERSLMMTDQITKKKILQSEIYLPNVFRVLVGASCTNVTICPHYLPIELQIAPIDYGNYVTTCPYRYYMHIYRYI